MELSVIAGLAVLVAGIAVGVTALHPWPDAGGAPVGATTPAVPAPSTSASATPAPSATAATTFPSPTGAPTPSTPPPSTATPSTPATEPSTTPAGGLVAPAGAVQRTDAEIRAYAAGRGFTDVWAQQGILDRDCMAEHGFLYDPEQGLATPSGLTAADRTAYEVALLGPSTSAPYDWRTAGCHGASVHETGQDNVN